MSEAIGREAGNVEEGKTAAPELAAPGGPSDQSKRAEQSEHDKSAPEGGAVDRDAREPANGVELPDDLAQRYRVRIVPTQGGEHRIGLYSGMNQQNPTLEVGGDRIVARREDPETVKDLVALAQHNGWETIQIAGTEKFRRAVWEEAASKGMSVEGYEPSMEDLQRVDARRQREAREAEKPTPARGFEEPESATDQPTASTSANRNSYRPTRDEQREQAREVEAEMVAMEVAATVVAAKVEPVSEQVHLAAEAVNGAAEREDEPGDRRASAREAAATVAVEAAADRKEVAEDIGRAEHYLAQEHRIMARAEQDEGLAELFLNGTAEEIAKEPRLQNAVRSQQAMEHNIEHVFAGDANGIDAARLESRQLISDALRQGLDVSVREITPERQIEPNRSADLER